MMSTYCIFMLLFAWIHIKDVHLFEIRSESICYGNTFSSLLNLECGIGEVILVRQTLAMAKLSSTGCPIERTSFNDESLDENCCLLEDEDCGTVYTGNVYQEYYIRCHGNQKCLSLQASWVDIVDLDCNQTLYLPRTNYMIFTYSCIPTDFIKSPCEGQQTTNNSVYLWNTGYPADMSVGSDSCLCAAEISCNSTIIITAIDLRFQEGSSGTCTQSILIEDSGEETLIDCQSNNDFIERTVYTSKSYFITLVIENTYMSNGGNFWIQISGEDENSKVTLSCGPSSITQAESEIKPVCGQGEATLSTSSTTAPSSTTTASTAFFTFTTAASTTSNSATTSSTTAASNITKSTADGNPNTSISTVPTTVSSSSNTPVNESHVTVSKSPTVSITKGHSSALAPEVDLDSSQQQKEESSGISGAVLGASIAVLVIFLLVVIILLCKRKQIKEKFCPTKVEDEGKDDTARPEYDTMPSLFLTDTTLPLLTGPAATSTQFPTLSGHGYVGKKSQLAPLTSPPKPQGDIFNLSSSLRYHLPKLDDIKTETELKPNNRSSERLAKTVQNVSEADNENRVMDAFTDEMTKETKSGEGQIQETKREKRIRKKKKRMIDRLNRIPVSGPRGSVMGFGSSSVRF